MCSSPPKQTWRTPDRIWLPLVARTIGYWHNWQLTRENGLLAERSEVLYKATGIEISKYKTGALDTDDRPGDDVLATSIAPHDSDGELIKLPGEVELELFDMAQPAEKQRIGHWQFTAEDCREHWNAGFFGSGYQFKLPWQKRPEHQKLVLHARMLTPDGRQFDASHELKVQLPQEDGPSLAGANTAPSLRRPEHLQVPSSKPRDLRLPGNERPVPVEAERAKGRAGYLRPAGFRSNQPQRLPSKSNRLGKFEPVPLPLMPSSDGDKKDEPDTSESDQSAPNPFLGQQSETVASPNREMADASAEPNPFTLIKNRVTESLQPRRTDARAQHPPASDDSKKPWWAR
jgi:hypothetical protein